MKTIKSSSRAFFFFVVTGALTLVAAILYDVSFWPALFTMLSVLSVVLAVATFILDAEPRDSIWRNVLELKVTLASFDEVRTVALRAGYPMFVHMGNVFATSNPSHLEPLCRRDDLR